MSKENIIIKNREVVLSVNGIESKRIPIVSFVKAIQSTGNCELFPDIIPDSVKLVVKRNTFTLVVLEQTAMPRGVFVIADDSPKPFGSKVKSVRRWLSFPYIYLFVLFHGPALTNFMQVFYRNSPLRTIDDDLSLCNLPNVSTRGPVPYWFCTQYIGDVKPLNWPEKIKTIIDHLWKTGFNWSSDHHEGLSQFNAMKDLDERITSFQNWEKATQNDPNFTLKIKWKSAEKNVRQTIDALFTYATNKNEIVDCKGLAGLLAIKKETGTLF